MGRRTSGMLVFEDATYGSYTAERVVPLAGYRWEGGAEPHTLSDDLDGKERGPWLVKNEPDGKGPWGVRDAPMSDANLQWLPAHFSKLRTPEGYLAFANTHGKLGHDEEEPLALWAWEARRVKALITLMGWVGKEDKERLGRVVRWTEGSNEPIIDPGASLSPLPWRRVVKPRVLRDATGRPRWKSGDVIGPAHYYLCDEINKSLKGHVNAKLMPFARADLFRVYTVPDCLLAAIYLQLQLIYARALPKKDNSKECRADGCTNRFETKGHKLYCSAPCVRWGRSRRNERYRRGAVDEGSRGTTPIHTPSTVVHKRPPTPASEEYGV